jgi:hypothetical protein
MDPTLKVLGSQRLKLEHENMRTFMMCFQFKLAPLHSGAALDFEFTDADGAKLAASGFQLALETRKWLGEEMCSRNGIKASRAEAILLRHFYMVGRYRLNPVLHSRPCACFCSA